MTTTNDQQAITMTTTTDTKETGDGTIPATPRDLALDKVCDGDRCPVCGGPLPAALRDRRVTYGGVVVCGRASCEQRADYDLTERKTPPITTCHQCGLLLSTDSTRNVTAYSGPIGSIRTYYYHAECWRRSGALQAGVV